MPISRSQAPPGVEAAMRAAGFEVEAHPHSINARLQEAACGFRSR